MFREKIILLSLLVSLAALAAPTETWEAPEGCPRGPAVSRGSSFDIQFGHANSFSDSRGCAVSRDRVTAAPLRILGCEPVSRSPDLLMVEAPANWNHQCFRGTPLERGEKRVFVVKASQFRFPHEEVRQQQLEDCQRERGPVMPAAGLNLTASSDSRGSPMARLINDMHAAENGQKSTQEIERYHSCWLRSPNGPRDLSRNQRSLAAYERNYRHLLTVASEQFGVPVGLLSCLCGRESRFQADVSAGPGGTGARGVCQATNANLEDVQKWRDTIPAVNEAFTGYLRRLQGQGLLERPGCATARLTKDNIVACPSLGFAAAATYLSNGYARVQDGQRRIGQRMHWQNQSLDTLVTLAASYNMGVGLTVQAMNRQSRASRSHRLLAATCEHFGAAKVQEVVGHMVGLRACLQAGTWLDHQGKPLGGECQGNPAENQRQVDALARYRANLSSVSCGR